MKFLFLIALYFLLPSATLALCNGTDLRKTLSPTGRAWVEERLADMPFTNGNHWVATRGTRVLHIIGTLHFDDARMDDVVDRLEPIIEKSDAVLFEINSADLKATPRNLANNMDLLIIAQGPTLLELLPEKDWKTLSRLTVSHGLPPWMATKMKPWFLSTMLANPVCMGKLKDMQREIGRAHV